jgi:hypothetical protein
MINLLTELRGEVSFWDEDLILRDFPLCFLLFLLSMFFVGILIYLVDFNFSIASWL